MAWWSGPWGSDKRVPAQPPRDDGIVTVVDEHIFFVRPAPRPSFI